jgi:hypothetical protein
MSMRLFCSFDKLTNPHPQGQKIQHFWGKDTLPNHKLDNLVYQIGGVILSEEFREGLARFLYQIFRHTLQEVDQILAA